MSTSTVAPTVSRTPARAELTAMSRLALPVVAVQVGLMLLGVVDTIMVGRVSAEALAGVALGNLYWYQATIFGSGMLMALDPVVAQAIGARDHRAVARAVQRGVVLAALVTVLAALLLLTAAPVLRALRQPADAVPAAAAYARACIPGLLPYFLFIVVRQSLQAMGRLRPILSAIVVGNVLNAVLNAWLIFGGLGVPPLGVVGAAWASSIGRWVMALLLLRLAWPLVRSYLRPVRREAWLPRPLLRMLALGAPIGLQQQLESGAFALIALLMGGFGTVQVAAHQVAINLASLTFMVPLGVSAAAAVRVGHAVGRDDADGARRSARAALLIGTAFMCTSAVVFLVAPTALARLYTPVPAVVALAATLIPVAGVFQVFDGLQVVGAGVLRGAGDTRAPLYVNLLGFWALGTPVSVWLAYRTTLGPVGLWWGLVAGLVAVAAFLLLRIRYRLAGELRRVVIDEDARHDYLHELALDAPDDAPRSGAALASHGSDRLQRGDDGGR